MTKNINEEVELGKTAHPYALLDNDLPAMISLVYRQLKKQGIVPKYPLFRIYAEENQAEASTEAKW